MGSDLLRRGVLRCNVLGRDVLGRDVLRLGMLRRQSAWRRVICEGLLDGFVARHRRAPRRDFTRTVLPGKPSSHMRGRGLPAVPIFHMPRFQSGSNRTPNQA